MAVKRLASQNMAASERIPDSSLTRSTRSSRRLSGTSSPAILRLERAVSGVLAASATVLVTVDALDEQSGSYRIVLVGRLKWPLCALH